MTRANELIEIEIAVFVLRAVDVPGCEPYREYLYTYLRDQPIWHALRFWNAAYFDAVQCERSHRPVPPTLRVLPRSESSEEEVSVEMNSTQLSLADDVKKNLEMIRDDQQFQQNICFGQLGYKSTNTIPMNEHN